MVRFFRRHILQSPRRVNAIVLALVLLLGFLLGGICSGSADPFLLSLMRTAAQSRVSIVCLLPVLLLPVLCTAFAVYIGLPWLLFPIAFSKAFLFSYLCSAILIFYPESGSLFAAFFMFADYLSVPVLCWVWYRCICSRETRLYWIRPAVLLILGIAYLDYQVISPFLASLLS